MRGRSSIGAQEGAVLHDIDSDVVVIGSGVAGMSVALSCGLRRVTLLTKTDGLVGGSTHWAQGGIAAAIGSEDTPKRHAEDTIAVGHGLVDPAVAAFVAEEGRDAVERMISLGLPVDRGTAGEPRLSREAAHSRRRVVHAGGDATGRHLAAFLAGRVAGDDRVRVVSGSVAVNLVHRNGQIVGVMSHHADRGWVFFRTSRVVLATGGIGQAFAYTTNPPECTGDGLALAAHAGATLVDLEFVQFHPTALAVEGIGNQRPLLTEALRGDGAILLDETGRRFMEGVHPDSELAPRDVVAQAIWRKIACGRKIFLDLRPVMERDGENRFPTVFDICRKVGLDPYREAIPVAPVAHYHMGGVATDAVGRTDVPGLWACGEVACTGVHGANRLASNSLLEGIVFGARVARDLTGGPAPAEPVAAVPDAPALPVLPAGAVEVHRRNLNDLLYRGAGVVRDRDGMVSSLRGVAEIETAFGNTSWTSAVADPGLVRPTVELMNLATVAKAVLVSALGREESRGAHLRADFPGAAPTVARQHLTLKAIERRAEAWCGVLGKSFRKAC